jgi:hypothetical protein
MPVGEGDLYLPRRDFEYDPDQHEQNIRSLEAWAIGAKNLVRLVDHGVLPSAAAYKVGTILRVGNALYFLRTTGWGQITIT